MRWASSLYLVLPCDALTCDNDDGLMGDNVPPSPPLLIRGTAVHNLGGTAQQSTSPCRRCVHTRRRTLLWLPRHGFFAPLASDSTGVAQFVEGLRKTLSCFTGWPCKLPNMHGRAERRDLELIRAVTLDNRLKCFALLSRFACLASCSILRLGAAGEIRPCVRGMCAASACRRWKRSRPRPPVSASDQESSCAPESS